MQEVKYFLRAIGQPRPEFDVKPALEVEEDLSYKYLSQGYEVESTHYLGSVKDKEGNEIGYRLLHVLVRYEVNEAVEEEISVPARRGRPRKLVEAVPA